MEVIAVYKAGPITGRVLVEVDRPISTLDDFEKIEQQIMLKCHHQNLIVTNLIKLPFK